jgi:hypothetical protein
VLERLDTARLAFIETLWRRALGDTTRVATAALLADLLLIGANAARPSTRPAWVRCSISWRN